MEALLDEYGRILKELKFDLFNHNEDKYSGVFLPVPFDEYWSSRETLHKSALCLITQP